MRKKLKTKSSLLKELKKMRVQQEAFPRTVPPMLATKVSEAFDDDNFIFEIKWDGYRIMALKNKKTVLHTRKQQNYTQIYNSISESVDELPYNIVLDGEVIMPDKDGRPSFDLLQQVKTLGTSNLLYVVFDVLWFEGYNLMQVPLIQRKKFLDMLLPERFKNIVRYPYVESAGIELFEEMLSNNMEGIVAKERNSIYEPGIRTRAWQKIQTKFRQEFVIGGWTESTSGRPFRSLLFGYYNEDNALFYFGHAGGGYKEKSAKELFERLRKIEIRSKPFVNEVESDTKTHWVKPLLIGEFEFATITKSGKIRKPAIFKGLRLDKHAKEIRLDSPEQFASHKRAKKASPDISELKNDESNWPLVKRSLKTGSLNRLEIEGRSVELNNIEEVIWPNEGVTKADLLRYYIELSDFILPYVKDRPLSLHIKHSGVFKEGLYIKGMEANAPEWASTFIVERKHKSRGRSRKIDYLLCQDQATLVYLINLGCIDVNPWNSTVHNPLNPDYFIIDLDPTDSPFEQVIESALVAKKILDTFKIKSVVKTSGKTGLHILLPVRPVFSYHQARMIVSRLCELIHDSLPEITTTENEISRRGNKVFIDFNQNDEADTIAAPYSVRPYHIPTVSMPVTWKEINSKLKPADFTIQNALRRVKDRGDLFKNLHSEKYKAMNTTIIRNRLL